MDQTLLKMLESSAPQGESGQETTFRFLGPDEGPEGQIEVTTPSGPQMYTLKPLRELYGKGVGATSVNPQDERYAPLFLAIEEEIAKYDYAASNLTDGLVELTLEQMNMDPAGEPGQDALRRRLQLTLRLLLSLNDYSRQEVKTALRAIARSAARHKSLEGRQGYLTFIHEYVY